ncbi:MAG: hypothetical protein JKX91_08820 [Rhizobiaceae bacterium]|nr:hypothetical protein [Rhizobiaceae bacterium]
MIKLLPLIFITALALMSGNAIAQDEGKQLAFRLLTHTDQTITDIETICCSNATNSFSDEQLTSIRSHYGGKPFWIKLEGITKKGLVQFHPILDEVTLYTRLKGQSRWQISRTGDMVSNDEKDLITPFMALPLPDQVDADHIYARISQPVTVSIDVQYWTRPAFAAMQEFDRTIKTFLMGFIGALIIYNLIVSVVVRDPVFLFNAAAISSLLVTSLYLSGYGVIYVWGPWFAFSNLIFISSVWGGIVFGAAFLYTFLKIEQKSPRQYWPLLLAPAIATLSAFVLGVLQAPYWIMQGIVIGSAALLFLCVIPLLLPAALANEKRARILLFPLLFAMIPGLTLLSLDKILGVKVLNFGNNAMEITLALEVIMFSLALASRIRHTEAASRDAARRLLEIRERSSAMALLAQDRERKRLAADLHDGVGQEMLVVVGIMKRLAKTEPPSQFTKGINELTTMMSGVMNNLRRIAQDMHPASIEHLGLVGTIENLTDQFNQTRQIDFDQNIDVDGHGFTLEAQLHLIRIIQECLSNVAKHSGASRCLIVMQVEDDMLNVQIEDDGVGLKHYNGDDRSHFGLGMTSIDERVRGLGGQWNIQPRDVGGLTTNISIPIAGIAIA